MPVRIEVVRAGDAAVVALGRRRQVGRRGSTLVEFRLEPLASGGTRLHLRESGFEREDSRWSNTEGWMTELAELAKHVAVEPFEAGIRRTYALTSPLDRVWRAFSEPAELGAWWAGTPDLEIRPGLRGLVRLAQRGRPVRDADRGGRAAALPVLDLDAGAGGPARDAETVLRTEWTLVPREDGGTDLHLFESGFTEPTGFGMNSGGWDDDILPALRRHLGEAS